MTSSADKGKSEGLCSAHRHFIYNSVALPEGECLAAGGSLQQELWPTVEAVIGAGQWAGQRGEREGEGGVRF